MRATANKGARRAVGARLLRTGQRMPLQAQVVSLAELPINLVFCFLGAFLLASCATPKDVQHHVIISVKDQKLALLDRETLIAIYPVSTSKYGLGDWRGSFRTPLGELEIAQKIGGGMPPGTVFKDRIRTGEMVLPNALGRDPIVTRIIWLRGGEPEKQDAAGLSTL